MKAWPGPNYLTCPSISGTPRDSPWNIWQKSWRIGWNFIPHTGVQRDVSERDLLVCTKMWWKLGVLQGLWGSLHLTWLLGELPVRFYYKVKLARSRLDSLSPLCACAWFGFPVSRSRGQRMSDFGRGNHLIFSSFPSFSARKKSLVESRAVKNFKIPWRRVNLNDDLSPISFLCVRSSVRIKSRKQTRSRF